MIWTILQWYAIAGLVIFAAGALAGTKPTANPHLPTWGRWAIAFIAVVILWPISFVGFLVGLAKLVAALWRTRRSWS